MNHIEPSAYPLLASAEQLLDKSESISAVNAQWVG